MALSEDQKAMLRLLAQRGEQGYEDLSALLGIGAEQVHAKAQAAAAELEAEGIPAPQIPAPPGGASAAPSKPPRPVPAAAAAPAADEVEPPQAAKVPARQKPSTSRRSGFRLPESKGARYAIAANVLAVLAILVIVLVSAGDGSDDSSPAATDGAQAATETAREAAAATPNLTQAVLSPVDGGEAEGRAIFGRIKKNVVLQVQAEGLEPSPPGSSYTVWLYKSPKLALRIGAVKVTESGGIAAQFPLPTELLALVAGGAFDQIDLSLTDTDEYEAEIAQAKKEKRLPAYTGEDVLRGPITGPAIEAARKADRK